MNDELQDNRPIKAWIGVPLALNTKILGYLLVYNCSESSSFEQTDADFLEYASEHIAQAIARSTIENDLIQAKEKAEESDRLKSRFLANMSHEIRTPMNAIVGFSELNAEEDITDDERIYNANLVLKNAHYLLDMLTSIIELSKVQSGQIRLNRDIIKVAQALSGLKMGLGEYKEKVKKKDIEIVIRSDVNHKVVGDLSAFRQVMSCLTENAIKFTQEGSVTIGVDETENDMLRFYVKDTGIGIAQEEIAGIFDCFRQGATANRNLYRGTGLGLALAKELVEAQGGQLSVSSHINEGSCFSFTMKKYKTTPTFDLSQTKDRDQSKENANNSAASAG